MVSLFLAFLAAWRGEILVPAAGRAGMIRFVQQSQTQNGRIPQFFLLASGQGLTAIPEGGEMAWFKNGRVGVTVAGA